MTTPAQIEANRANATHSTGPKTPAGKARSALNSLTHAFRARIVLEHSSPADAAAFDAFLADLTAELAPVGVMQSQCVETIALALWRKRLVLEKEIDLTNEADADTILDQLRYELHIEHGEPVADPPPPPQALPHPEKLNPIVRYEAHLSREFRSALRLLADLQTPRLAKAPLESPARTLEPSSPFVSPAACSADHCANPLRAATVAPRPSSTILPSEPDSAPASPLAQPVDAAASAPRPPLPSVGAQQAAPPYTSS